MLIPLDYQTCNAKDRKHSNRLCLQPLQYWKCFQNTKEMSTLKLISRPKCWLGGLGIKKKSASIKRTEVVMTHILYTLQPALSNFQPTFKHLGLSRPAQCAFFPPFLFWSSSPMPPFSYCLAATRQTFYAVDAIGQLHKDQTRTHKRHANYSYTTLLVQPMKGGQLLPPSQAALQLPHEKGKV